MYNKTGLIILVSVNPTQENRKAAEVFRKLQEDQEILMTQPPIAKLAHLGVSHRFEKHTELMLVPVHPEQAKAKVTSQ